MIQEAAAILFYGFGDLATTKYLTDKDQRNEYNPIVRIILNLFGFGGFVLLKICTIFYIFIFVPSDIWIMILLGAFGTIWNIRQIMRYKSKHERRPI